MKYSLFTCLFITIALILFAFQVPKFENMKISGTDLTITILYDNYNFNKELESDWGFSCLIEGLEETILFDAGGDGKILPSNMKKIGKDPANVDIVVFSHMHQDHTGGADLFFNDNPGVTVFLPASFPENFKEMIKDKGAIVKEVTIPLNIMEGVFSTGEMGTSIIEQSLIIQTENGSVIITGCAHPGILEILKKSAEVSGNNILLVMGGFHLLRNNKAENSEIIDGFREMKVKYAGPTHCSGDKTIEIFKEEYGNYFMHLGAGRILKLNEL